MSISELVSKIKEYPISSIISRYLRLEKHGQNLFALCPFHDDRNPSFSVSDEKKLFKCFTCDIGGDAITFVQKHQSLDFISALKEITQILGIPPELYFEQKDEVEEAKRRRISTLMSLTVDYYQECATRSHEFQNFIKNRSLHEDIIKKFKLGFAPANNGILALLKKRFPNDPTILETAFELGLIKEGLQQNNNSTVQFDTFRDRIIFPITNSHNYPVGIGSRAIHSYQKAKYLNSKESYLFNKRKILYGLSITKSYILDQDAIILVEGYMDLLSLYQRGIKNVVAIMGVGLNDYLVKIIRAMTINCYMALDSDQAGLNAMKRGNRELLKFGLIPKFVNLGKYKDPDEFITKEGKEEFESLLKNSHSCIDMLTNTLIPDQVSAINIDKKINILDKIFDILSPLGPSMYAIENCINLAQKLSLHSSSEQIIQSYKSFLEKQKYTAIGADSSEQSPAPLKKITTGDASSALSGNLNANSSPARAQHVVDETLTPGEKNILYEIILHPKLLEHKEFIELLEQLAQNDVRRVVRELREIYFEVASNEYKAVLTNILATGKYPLNIKEIMASALYMEQNSSLTPPKLNKLLTDLTKKIKIEKLNRQKTLLFKAQIECDNQKESEVLLSSIYKIEKEISTLRSPTR